MGISVLITHLKSLFLLGFFSVGDFFPVQLLTVVLFSPLASDKGNRNWQGLFVMGMRQGWHTLDYKCRDVQRSDKQFTTELGYPWCSLLAIYLVSKSRERGGNPRLWAEKGRKDRVSKKGGVHKSTKEQWESPPGWRQSGLHFFSSLSGLIHRMKSCSVWCVIYQRQGISNLCSRAQITDR